MLFSIKSLGKGTHECTYLKLNVILDSFIYKYI